MLNLTDRDQAMLDGDRGPAAALAMSILVQMADVRGAAALMDISQAHIDNAIYLGEATLELAERLASLGARVAVPTSLNVSGVDECGWQEWAVTPWQSKRQAPSDGMNSRCSLSGQSCGVFSWPPLIRFRWRWQSLLSSRS